MNQVCIKLAISCSIHISIIFNRVTNFIMPEFGAILEFMTKTNVIFGCSGEEKLLVCILMFMNIISFMLQ